MTSEQPGRRRGRPPRISRDDVLETANSMPLDEVTIEAVSERLGVSRAAIYRYVTNSDELRSARATAGVSRLEFTGDEIDDWKIWLRSFAHATRAWLLENAEFRDYMQLSAEVLASSGMLEPVEHGINLLIGAGFSEAEAPGALHFIIGVVWINARDEMMARTSGTSEHPQTEQFKRLPAGFLEGYPHTRRIIESGGEFTAKQRFEREINWAIAGLANEVTGTSS